MTQKIDLGALRYNFTGIWNSATLYNANDLAAYGGNTYVYTYALATTGNLPTNTSYWTLMIPGLNFRGAYNAATIYLPGDAMAYGGKIYQCTQGCAGTAPPNTAYWNLYLDAFRANGVYTSTGNYLKGDVVVYGANAYIALSDTTGNAPSNATYWQLFISGTRPRGAWVANTAYLVNDIVTVGGSAYLCITANTSSAAFATDNAKWQLYSGGIRWLGNWAAAVAYQVNDVVAAGGSCYICLTAHASTSFTEQIANWQQLAGGLRYRGLWSATTAYLQNDLVSDGVSTYIVKNNYTSGAVAASADLIAGNLQIFALGQSNIPPLTGNAGKYLGTADGLTLSFIGNVQQWTVINAQTNAVAGNNYMANSSTGPFPILLPATPANNDTVRIVDGASSFSGNPVTVANNGNLLMGSNQNLVLDVTNASITLVFNTTLGWRII